MWRAILTRRSDEQLKSNMQDFLPKSIESIFLHSTARAFLVFSSILLIFSIGYAKEFILVAFFTFFYALIAHRMAVFKRVEWGDYTAVSHGIEVLDVILYFLLDWLLFAGWIIGTIILLNEKQGLDLLGILQIAEIKNPFILLHRIAISALLTFIIFVVRIFWKISRKTKILSSWSQ